MKRIEPILLPLRQHGQRHASRAILPVILGLALAQSPLHAQTPPDQIVPFAADVKSLQVVLQPSGIPATLKFANSGNNVFYFPVVGIQNAEVRNGSGQFTPSSDAQGRLQIPNGVSSTILCITLRDFLQDVELQNEILQNLATNGFVRQFAPSPVLAPAAVQPGRIARLIFSDPAANNARRILGESLLTDADANPTPKASFFLNADALALLRTAPEARNLSVVVDQSYRAQFRSTDLQITLQSAQDSLANVLRSLKSIPAGRPTYLLSPSLPLQMPGGVVGKDSSFNSRVRSATKLDVLVRQGSNVDPNLMDRMLNFAFDQANLAIAVSAEERQRAVATILLDDGLSITLPLGRIHDIAVDIRSDASSQYSRAFIDAATKNSHTAVHGSVDVGIGIFGGSASADVTRDWSRSDYVSSKLDQFSHQLDAMSANLSGDFPYVTGMSFTDAGTVRNLNFTDVEQNFTQFSVDYATLQSTRSLQEYAQQLNMARQVEALLVPQVLVGREGQHRSWEWSLASDSARFVQIPVVFDQPFAASPEVIVAVSHLDGANNANTRIYSVPQDIRPDGFTLYVQTWADSTVYGVSISWIAAGKARVSTLSGNTGLAALGNPDNNTALIPAEARQAVLTPVIDAVTPTANSGLQFAFNAIPGRAYDVLASTNLVDWASIGSATATDFTMLLATSDNFSYPHRFFRVTTP